MKTLTKSSSETIVFATLLTLWVSEAIVFNWPLAYYKFGVYNIIPVLFFAYGFALTTLISRVERRIVNGLTTCRKAISALRIFKICKIASSVIFVVCYINFIGESNVVFGITFGIYYAAFFVVETIAVNASGKRCREKSLSAD